MSVQTVPIGPFAAIYVGDFGASSVLVEVPGVTTGDELLVYEIPQAFSHQTGNYIQSGPASVSVKLNFLSEDGVVMRLANGNSLDAATPDSPSEFAQYVLLLVHVDEDYAGSVLIPKCATDKLVSVRRSKGSATDIPLVFSHQNPDRNQQLYFMRTAGELATILGARSPI